MGRPVVVVTRRGSAGDPLARPLRDGGVEVRWLPTTSVLPPLDPAVLDESLERLDEVDWLVFTSAHAVEAVVGRQAWASPQEGRPRVAAVGDHTADRLARSGAPAHLVASSPGATGLVAALVSAEGGSLAGRRVLWPRSDIARRGLADGLLAAGAALREVVAYRTVAATPAGVDSFRADLDAGGVDAVCFLSPSAAEGLAAALGDADLARLRGRCVVASLGPTTSETLVRLGAPPDVQPPRASAPGLAAALLARFSSLQGAFR